MDHLIVRGVHILNHIVSKVDIICNYHDILVEASHGMDVKYLAGS